MFISSLFHQRQTRIVFSILMFCLVFIPIKLQAQFETLTFETQAFQVTIDGLPPSSNCGPSAVVMYSTDLSNNNVTTAYPEENDDVTGGIENIRIANLDEIYAIRVRVNLNPSIASTANWGPISPSFIDSINWVNPSSSTGQMFDGTVRFRPQQVTIDGNENYVSMVIVLNASYYNQQTFSNINNQIQMIIPMMVGGISRNVEPRGVTVMPQIPFMVLHDPPGDASFSEVSNTFSTSQSFSQSFQIDNENRIYARAKIGGGVPGFVSAYGSLEAGFTFGVNQSTLTETEMTISSTKTYTTSQEEEILGGDADVFIGSGPTIAYGVAQTLTYDPTTCRPKLGKTLTFSPTGVNREFILTADGIRRDIEIQQQIVASPPSELVKRQAQAQIDAWNKVLQQNEANKQNAPTVSNQIFDGGTTFANSLSVSTTTTNSVETRIIIGADVAVEVGAEILGNEFSGGAEISLRSEFGESTTTSSTQERSVSYTLQDGEPDNRFAIQVGRDPMYGTPTFKMENGTRTSCPYEGGYRLDQPKLSASFNGSNTKNIIVNNAQAGTTVSLPLNICNDSDVSRTYYLKLSSSSNVNGAKISYAGTLLNNTDNGVAFQVPAGGCFSNGGALPTLLISQNDVGSLSYPDMKIFLYPLCEGSDLSELSIVDVINVSVNFVANTDPCLINGVPDNIAPIVTTCPPNQTITNNPGYCGQFAFFDPPTATDNVGISSITQTEGPASGETFFIGTTTVSYLISDVCGNSTPCSFNVTVVDNEPPQFLSAPQDMTLNVNAGFCSQLAFFDPPQIFDNCDAVVRQIAGPASGENFFPGTTTVTFEATDNSGNTSQASFNVTVVDNEAPVLLSCPNDIDVQANIGSCGANVNYSQPTAMDNCTFSTSLDEGLASGENFPIGTTRVVYSFTDNFQNSVSCSFNVSVRDQEAPTISNCPETINITTATDACSAIVDWEVPTASDNCSNVNVIATIQPGIELEVGETMANYTFTDDAGNTSVCAFAIIVAAGDTAFCEGSVGIKDKFTQQQSFSVFPNPTSGSIRISFEASLTSETSISLFGLDGKRLFHQQHAIKVGQQQFQLSLNEIPEGIYYLRMQNREGLMSKKIVVRR